jgi:hypothetical protein
MPGSTFCETGPEMKQHKSIGFETPTQNLWKVLVMVGVGLGGAAPAFAASHGGHHGGGHAGAAHRGHAGGSYRGGHANAGYRGQAGGYHRGGTANNGRSAAQGSGHRGYYAKNGRPFQGGYYYPGRNHPHWAYTVYDNRYGCTLYYDADLGSYYYWCQPDDCYYPVSYCPYDQYVWTSDVNDQHSGDKDPLSDEVRQLRTMLEEIKARLR